MSQGFYLGDFSFYFILIYKLSLGQVSQIDTFYIFFFTRCIRGKGRASNRRREEATGEEPTVTVAQPTPLQAPPSDEILPTTEAAVDDEEEEQVPQNAPLPFRRDVG